LKAPVKTDIRSEIWLKLWGNAVFNPISALTGATLRAICEYPGTAQLARTVMREVELVANALGVFMPVSLERRMAGAAAIGEHKTSMLQDLEKGRPLELDAIVAAVIELAQITGVAAPRLQELYSLARLRAESLTKACDNRALSQIS
jgi:2-dehydropantoate 2-reductase